MPQNRQQASQRAIQESRVQQLDNLGTAQSEFEDKLTVIENVLGSFITRVKENIDKETDMVTTGAISNITLKAEGESVNVMGSPHLIYQDRGVNGSKEKLYDTPHSYTDKMPPVDVFIEWIKRKHINLKNNEKYSYKKPPFKELTEEEEIEKAAWGMAKKVFNEGFRPRNLYSKEIPKLVEDLKEQLTGFAVQQIVQAINVKESAKRIIITV